jgi:DNA-binding NarL/FixJ family response regulator
MDTSIASLCPTRVFLVEDSAPILERLTEMLQEIEGVRIIGSADSADAASAAILRERPDTVVLDLRLASGSGIDVLRSVHPAAPGVDFIVLTNFASPQYRRICLEAGASHFIDKSTQIGEVKRLIAARAAARH